ncbi:uncharacterized protein LOC122884263 [Siniperca chuatsi]|uniref:uncharacterized protein LOC122884263 n=1 Tax=Siniperca chuatsi TaxID=119488 RepID=UPI001CE0563D|nr:uncharacterized protein LOC122884263 [Siniperca chuatsi]
MALNRRDVLLLLLLLLVGQIATAAALSGDNKTGQTLDCVNDMDEWIFCRFEAQNCVEYNVTVRMHGFGLSHRVKDCILKQFDAGRCCCSVQEIFVIGETFTATVWKGDISVESKIINVRDSLKPKTPTIISVEESNGNFQVIWNQNTKSRVISNELTAYVTYQKKGDTGQGFKSDRTVKGLNYYEIPGRHLKPSTTYVVSVKSHMNWSGLFSDSSEEWEFTTPVSPTVLLLAIIISLSIAAVIISGALYGCYVKFKTKWRDTVAKCPNPKLLIMHPSKQEVLKPVPPVISSICVELLVPGDSKPWSEESLRDTSSEISTTSSNTEPAHIVAGVQDALDKAFANISLIPLLTTNPLGELKKDTGLFTAPYNPCGGFDNKTYFAPIPSCPHEIMTDGSEVQTEAEMLCDSAHDPSEGDIATCADQQVPACLLVTLPPVASSLMTTDMSYQQCNADSGRFSSAEDSSLSSISRGTDTTASCDPVSRVKGFDEVVSGATKLNGKTEEAAICGENPCHGRVPAGSHSFPPVDDDYQAFQNLVEQPDI